jgi:PAS domain S-box-containing protein
MRNSCLQSEGNPSVDSAAKDESVPRLLERISELEDENASLRRLEETIRVNNHFFEALLRSCHEAIVLLNPALTVVRLVHSIMGYTEKDILGQSVLAFTHPNDAPLLENACASLLSGEAKSRLFEVRALTPDGNWTWMEVHLSDLLDDPNVQAIVLNLRRISKPASN